MPETPRAATALLAKLSSSVPAWSAELHHGSGPCEFTTYGDYRGDGTRPLVKISEVVESVSVRARHVDGRAIVAVWMRRPGNKPDGKRWGWTLDQAWRGKHVGEYTPRRLTATQLNEYLSLGENHIGLTTATTEEAA